MVAKLPGKDHEIAQLDPLERLENILLAGALLFYVYDEQALLAELVGHGHRRPTLPTCPG